MHPLFASVLGGVLIGLSAALLLLFNGRIAGISGIFGGLLRLERGDRAGELPSPSGWWQVGWSCAPCSPRLSACRRPQAGGWSSSPGSWWASARGWEMAARAVMARAGLAQGSLRSLAATVAFMASAAVTVFLVRHVLGGLS